MAERFGMYVEYGAYPHRKRPDDTELAAVQEWTNVPASLFAGNFGGD
ncbi:hypothetical protein Mesil_0134 [Allomeiothermus silvanus DSM 9946]|uniref:Uncharacterized protein n=1 Tax=Allomeiothermus silvanus (strain ATCC 700542 / DSM 9946 / NBRC 106475 / NCIMB 13440 / VI-R2) TaxID=526227 RepID=D7BGS5_ALLS1|nr:hypothetical protein Mesil_0134 [Allomeiothermus silvanus DSM 9946]